MIRQTLAIATLSLITTATSAAAEGDAVKGKAIYKRCAVCHEISKEKNKVGPHLVAIVGREAGVVADYKYSKSLLAKAAEGFQWSKENLDRYLEKPKAVIPNGKMAFAGLARDTDRANVIAYLEEAGKPAKP